MSRRRSSKQDSLELLLDTICNTFGGVLFIAILVVLLLQQTGANPVSATPDQIPVSVEEFQTITARFDTVMEELARLRLNRTAQDSVVQTFAPETLRQLMVTKAELTARQESLQTKVDEQLVKNTEAVIEVETLKSETDSIETRLADSRLRLAASEAKLAAERKTRVHETKMPVLHDELHKTEIGVVLQYGRLYVWHKYQGLQRLGLNTDDFVAVGEKDSWLLTQPNPTAGVPLDQSPQSAEATRRVLKPFDPQRCNICVIVRPDSYEEFRHLRDRMIELGLEYRLMPTGNNDPISDRGGSGGPVQ